LPERLSSGGGAVELARFRRLSQWAPKVGDFVIWTGWIRRWYGVVSTTRNSPSLSGISVPIVRIIRDGLPKLLFTMPEDEYDKNSIEIAASRILNSRGGEYCVLSNGVWYVDE
jgi:hypothetical protein